MNMWLCKRDLSRECEGKYRDCTDCVLDKIRAEIMDFEEELFHRPNTDYSDYSAVRYCVEIIDKYKAESEDKE
jgi:hypothetical protein